MKVNQKHTSTWGYTLMTLVIAMLAFALMAPQASNSVAQEPRPTSAPTRPGTSPTREAPPPPTSPPEPTATPGPTSPPREESPTVEATVAPVPVVMPETGGAGGGLVLLLIGLAFTATGIGASVVRYRRK